jgi:hypothetical protein
MKDVIRCDKCRSGACNRYEPIISEWGNPARVMSSTNKCSSLVIGDPLK